MPLRSTSLKSTISSIYVARGWSAVMGLVFVPLYMRLMGAEAFGLVGLFVMLQAVFALLDAGLGSKLNRDYARLSVGPSNGQEFHDLLRTLEIPLWTAATLGGAILLGIGPLVAHHWLNIETLSLRTVAISVRLMGLILLFQLPLSIYAGGLMGLQHQVLNSSLNAVWYTLRFAGGALAVLFVAPTPEVFFTWQLIVAIVSTSCTAMVLRRCLPAGERQPKLRWNLLTSSWRFTTGLGAISVTILILNQADKLILSKLLPLKDFGYYTLAWTVANGLRMLAEPMFSAIFPKLSYLVGKGEERDLASTYHSGCQIMTLILVPAGAFLALFAPEITFLWVRNSTTAEQTHRLIAILAVGNTLLGLVVLPYALQLAHGWTSLGLTTNIAFTMFFVPLLWAFAPRYGAEAAAWLWLVLNAAYICITVPMMHQRLLRRELWRWCVNDVAMSAVAAVFVLGSARMMFDTVLTPVMTAVTLGGVLVASQCAALLASPISRSWPERYWKMGRAIFWGNLV